MAKTVLLVTGNKTLVMYMGVLLKRMGFNMVYAVTGREAMSLRDIVSTDVIVVDGDVKEFDGLEGLERSRPGGPSVPPVIMLVGSPTEESERRCMLAGASSIVSKPVHVEDMHHAIQDCVFSHAGVIRRHVRARVGVHVTVNHDGRDMRLTTESLSAGGAFITHDTMLKVGALVDVLLKLGENNTLYLSGRVIYNHKPCDNRFGICPGFAVEFVGHSADEAGMIREFVNGCMTKDIRELQQDDAADLAALPNAQLDPQGVYTAIKSYGVNNGIEGEASA